MCCNSDSLYLGRIGESREIITATGTAVTVASSQDKPLVAAVYEFPCAFMTNGGYSTVEEIRLRETVEDEADVKRAAARIHVFNWGPTTTPVANTVYVPQTDRLAGTILVADDVALAESQWLGYRRISAKVHEAYVRCSLDVRARSGESSLWAVIVSDATVTYAASTTLDLTIVIRRHS